MMLGAGGGMAPTLESSERGLTVSSVMKEIAVLKDKFKSDDEDHCACSFRFGWACLLACMAVERTGHPPPGRLPASALLNASS